MTGTLVNYTPAERVDEDDMSWEQFEGRLAAVLGRMAAGSYLILSSREDDEIVYYVQFAQGGRGGIRAEAESNNFLAGRWALSPVQEEQLAGLGWQCPMPGDSDLNFMRQWPTPAPYAEIARLAVRSLREVYGIQRPAELVYRRFAKTGSDFAEPALGLKPEKPVTATGRAPRPVPTFAELTLLVERAVKGFLGLDKIVRDGDGCIPIQLGDSRQFVKIVDGTPSFVRVFSTVLHGVDSSRPLLEALNEINGRSMFGRVLWVSGEVIVSAEVSAVGINVEQLTFVCLQIGTLAEGVHDQLRDRLGRQTMFDEAPKLVN